jgi:hypothetical protein
LQTSFFNAIQITGHSRDLPESKLVKYDSMACFRYLMAGDDR